MDAWRKDLEERIRRAQLKLELLDFEDQSHIDLADEVAAFREICFRLAGSGPD